VRGVVLTPLIGLDSFEKWWTDNKSHGTKTQSIINEVCDWQLWI